MRACILVALIATTSAVTIAPNKIAVGAPHKVPPQKYSVSLVALGCPKNTVDAEVMLGDLQRNGLRVGNT